jgi:DNA-binding transcriptional MocR family regulator
MHQLGAVDKLSDRASYRQIADRLEELIRQHMILFGEKLPSETMLAQHYGVARTTVRLALSELRAAGLVRSEQGRGVFANLSNEPKKEKGFPGVFYGVRSADGPILVPGTFLLRMVHPALGELYEVIPNDWRELFEAPELLGEIRDLPDPSDFWPHYSWKPAGGSEWLGHELDIRDWQEAANALVLESRSTADERPR